MTQFPILYRSDSVPEIYLRASIEQDDPQLVELIKEVMPSNGMLLSFERNPSYLKAIQIQSTQTQSIVIVSEKSPQLVLGMMLMVWKNEYIDQKLRPICYLCDLRFSPQLRGKKAIRLIMDFLRLEQDKNTIYKSVILTDNSVALDIFHVQRENYPKPLPLDLIQTYSIGFSPIFNNQKIYRICCLDESKLEDLQQFLISMQEYYNFLPNFDFSEMNLKAKHPFWGDLKLENFFLVLDQNQNILGIYGLWNQKKIKQIRVLKYTVFTSFFRPFYNAYVHFRGGLSLPKAQGIFEYLLMHSPLCAPQNLDVFESMLSHAQEQTKKMNQRVFSLTLAENDPRNRLFKSIKLKTLKAQHALHYFNDESVANIDHSKISFIDICRI